MPTTLSGGGLNNPTGLAVDTRGDLFAANGNNNGVGLNSGTITEFAFNSAADTFGPGTTVATGLFLPVGLAYDARGDLFTTNDGDNTITEIASTGVGTFGPGTIVATGLNQPVGLAVDAHGDLFAANQGGGSITEFASTGAGAFGPGTTFATGLNGPVGLAFDAGGDLFATANNSITEFAFNSATGMFGAAQTVETGLNAPFGIAFSPVPAVPEASTTVSLGLLLALGMGGLVVASRKKRKA